MRKAVFYKVFNPWPLKPGISVLASYEQSGDQPVVATFNTKKAKSVHDFITFDEFLENLMPKLVETQISMDNTKVKNVWKRNPLTGYFLPMPRPETPPLEM